MTVMIPASGPLAIVARYFWLSAIAVTCMNAAVWWKRAQEQIAQQPELEEGYRRLIRGWLIFANIPWIVMGIGVLFGGVPGVFHYFNARNGPFVIAWYVSIVAIWLLAAWWLFARRGAEEIARYPALFQGTSANSVTIKVTFVLSILGGIAVLAAFIFGDFRSPRVQ